MESMETNSRLLFLCTGNYYRSRFVELLFNHHAEKAALSWRAESRGIALEFGVNNRGPISSAALAILKERGIVPAEPLRFPLQVQEEDFSRVQRIIALEDAEHRPLMIERFPHWLEQVEFWQVPDVPRAKVADAVATMTSQVESLIQELTKERLKRTMG
jgi:protein-tyrosine phosphatase